MSESYNPTQEEISNAEGLMDFNQQALSERREKFWKELDLDNENKALLDELSRMEVSRDDYNNNITISGELLGHKVHISNYTGGIGEQVLKGTIDGIDLTPDEIQRIYTRYIKFKDLERVNGILTSDIGFRADELKKEAGLKDLLG